MDVSGEMLRSLHQANPTATWLRMTDPERNVSAAFQSTALSCIGTNASAALHLSPEARPHGWIRSDLSAVAAQVIEAAFRAHNGEHEAAKAHIERAVTLLQCTANPQPAPAAARGETKVVGFDSGDRRPNTGSSHPLDHVRLRRVLTYVSRNIDADITLATLAGIAGYSAFHFARKFTLAVGLSPYRYVSRVRLRRAMLELAMGKVPLAQIALNAHFSSQASFTRAFHRTTGLTPKKYQRSRLQGP